MRLELVDLLLSMLSNWNHEEVTVLDVRVPWPTAACVQAIEESEMTLVTLDDTPMTQMQWNKMFSHSHTDTEVTRNAVCPFKFQTRPHIIGVH